MSHTRINGVLRLQADVDEIERLTRNYSDLSFRHEAVLLANCLLIERDEACALSGATLWLRTSTCARRW